VTIRREPHRNLNGKKITLKTAFLCCAKCGGTEVENRVWGIRLIDDSPVFRMSLTRAARADPVFLVLKAEN